MPSWKRETRTPAGLKRLSRAVRAIYSGWKSGRPRKDSLKASWISWPLVTVISGAVMFTGLVHAASLLGLPIQSGATTGAVRLP